ncbi:hypothetical protein GGI07_005406 [Coemansia sp. Benny D115]|nr:hypothetical protein GGI07_005406 [Coemansia sp. Benny D115]
MAKSVTWAISLENHVYQSFEKLPAHIAKYLQQRTPAAQELLKQRLYNPPFAVNSFTQSIPRTKVLPAKKASKKGSSTPVYESSIEVDLEIRGIRDGWMRTKSMLLNPIDPAKHTPKPGDKTSIMLFALFTILYSYISVLGVPTLVSVFMCVMLIASLACLSFGAWVFYWLSPRSRWMGYSRTSFVISLAAICFASLSSISTKLSLLPAVLPSVVISAVLFIIMTKAPLNPLLWWATVRKFMQELPDSTELDDAGTYRRIIALNETSDQQSSDSNRSTLDIPTPPATPGNGTTEEELEAQPTESPKDPRAERITAARKHVDRLVLQWTPKIAIALFSLVLLYSMIAPRTPVESQALGRIGYFLLNCAVVLQWVQWVPQVMINHRARAGNLVPVAVNAAHLAVTLIILVAASMVRVDIPTSRIFKEILPQVMNLIIVAQWAMYYWSD